MKTVVILGSPRENSNSSFLAHKVLEPIREKGFDIQEFVLSELNYKGCRACLGCQTRGTTCETKDDLSPVLDAMWQAKNIVLATPIYFGDVSGQFKTFFDRTYSFIESGLASSLMPGKRSVFITCQAQPDPKVFADVIPRFDKFLRMYGFTTYSLCAAGHKEAGSVQTDEAIIRQAIEIGNMLVD